MIDNHITLLCVVDGTCNVFPVKIPSTGSFDDLKRLIKAERAPRFDNFVASELTIWHVCIPLAQTTEDNPIILGATPSATEPRKLGLTDHISDLFKETPPKKTIHIVIQPPKLQSAFDSELANLRRQIADTRDSTIVSNSELVDLRRQVADMRDSAVTVDVVVEPHEKASFSWSAPIDTVTLHDLKIQIFHRHPHLELDDKYMQVFANNTQHKPECIRGDDDLRRILKVVQRLPRPHLTISLATPTKPFDSWTFKDVCEEYGLSESSDPILQTLPPFSGIQLMPLDSDFQKSVQNQLIVEIEFRVDTLNLFGANDATKLMMVSPFLVAATRLFKNELYLAVKRNLSGRRGNGPLDFSVHPRGTHDYVLCVTGVKNDDFAQAVAQNIVQLESALTPKKRKRKMNDVDRDENPRMKQRSYGIVTDAANWAFIECTLHEDDKVTYGFSALEECINYHGNWQKDARRVFGKISWLFKRMYDDIPIQDRFVLSSEGSSPYSQRSEGSSPHSKRINLSE